MGFKGIPITFKTFNFCYFLSSCCLEAFCGLSVLMEKIRNFGFVNKKVISSNENQIQGTIRLITF